MPKENAARAGWLETVAKPLLEHLPSLYPVEEWDDVLDAKIEALGIEQLTAGNVQQEPYALAVKAGLHLFNESLDKSHTISQEITNNAGSYWHGLMHRMEGDYSNAKYWFADAGHYPANTALITSVRDYLPMRELAELENEALRAKLEALITCPVWNPARRP